MFSLDTRVQKQKRIQHEGELGRVTAEGPQVDNVYSFEYLGSRVQCDGDEKADVEYRMVIAQSILENRFIQPKKS